MNKGGGEKARAEKAAREGAAAGGGCGKSSKEGRGDSDGDPKTRTSLEF
jgi:hypothetical protein